jgi:hypothetical protein
MYKTRNLELQTYQYFIAEFNRKIRQLFLYSVYNDINEKSADYSLQYQNMETGFLNFIIITVCSVLKLDSR